MTRSCCAGISVDGLSTHLDLSNSTFSRNVAESGGSLFFDGAGSALVTRSTFAGNVVAVSGGAIAHVTDSLSLGVTDSLFVSCTVRAAYLRALVAPLALTWPQASSTVGATRGGGLYAYYPDIVSLAGNVFQRNDAGTGGGIWWRASLTSTLPCYACEFVNNTGYDSATQTWTAAITRVPPALWRSGQTAVSPSLLIKVRARRGSAECVCLKRDAGGGCEWQPGGS